MAALSQAGFDRVLPAVVSLTGVTRYVTQGAVQQTLRDVAGLAPGTTYVATFVVPLDAVDPADRDLVSLTIRRNKARGTPWLSTFTPGQFARLAQEPSSIT